MRYQDLSASQKAGQRLMVGFEGLTLDDTLKFYIERLKPAVENLPTGLT